MNSVTLIGRASSDISYMEGKEGKVSVARFNLAVDREKSNDGADFIRIVVFGKTADNVHRYLSKGRQVGILGRISTGSYTDKEGKKVYTTEVVANRVEFLGSKPKAAGGTETNSAPVQKQDEDLGDELADDVPF